MHLHRGVIHLLVAMSLYKDISCNASSPVAHTLALHLHVTHILPSSMCLFTLSPHEMSIHFVTVVREQSWLSLWCQAHMAGDVEFVLIVT
jgi:hypothetical protein